MDEDMNGSRLNLTHLVRPASEKGGESAGVPGLVLLHGRGADEEDLMGLEGALDGRFTVISPRAPFRFGPGYAWYLMTQEGGPDEESFAASREEIRTFLEELPRAYGIDPRRLYLLGFNQGAILASALAMMMPEAIAGVVMHSGYMAAQHAGLDLDPAGLAGKPFFVAHGKYDDVIPVTWGRDAQEYLEEAGAAVIYKEYPIGHTISEESLYDMSEWLTVCVDASEKVDGK